MKHRSFYLLVAIALVLTASVAAACTIPVFRFALERWEADRLLVVVYSSGPLGREDEAAVRELAARSTLVGGVLNIEVVRYDVAAPPANLAEIKPPLDRPLPWLEVRSRLRGPQAAVRWEGPLSEVANGSNVFDSPARQEVIRRLLDGDSAVWLVVGPAEKNATFVASLEEQLAAVRSELMLPAGIGLPGSELYASIPLEIRFSVLAVSHDDALEQAFLKQLATAAKDWRKDEAYVIPVFGRLRALEVIPYGEVDDFAVRDICEFFCGACSCRVKQANPGFDLVAAIEWQKRLFGDAAAPPSEGDGSPLAAEGPSETPQYVNIPAGTAPQPAAATDTLDEPGRNEKTGLVANESSNDHSPTPYIFAALIALIAGSIATVFVAKRRR
jgi:hypothetical protein